MQNIRSAIILAGGGGSRMQGLDKTRLPLGSTTILERQRGVLASLFDEVLISIGQGDEGLPEDLNLPGVRIVRDRFEAKCALSGICSALCKVAGGGAMVVACDMPFVRENVVRLMLSLSEGYDVVIPRQAAGLEPLHALYSTDCIPHMEAQLRRMEMRIVGFFPRVRVREVSPAEWEPLDPRSLSWVNVNTVKDYERVKRLVAQDPELRREFGQT